MLQMLASGCAKKPFLRGQYLVDLGSSVERRGSKKEKCVKTLRERERGRICEILTQFSTILAVHIEGLITFVNLAVQWIEDKTIGAELRLGDTIFALIIFIALPFVLELSIRFGAIEFGSSCVNRKKRKQKSSLNLSSQAKSSQYFLVRH